MNVVEYGACDVVGWSVDTATVVVVKGDKRV